MWLAGVLLGGAVLAVAVTEASARAACGQTTVVGVAHQDDDLLFVNPDLGRDLQAGRCLRVVYLTAGDAGREAEYYESRERGVQQAYASLAGVTNTWVETDFIVDEHPIRSRSLSTGPGRPDIQLVFLRLPDGWPDGSGSSRYGRQSLLKLVTGKMDTIEADDGSTAYTHKGLISTLAALLLRFDATTVRTLDYHNTVLDHSIVYPVDHSDHSVTGRSFRAATARARIELPKLRLVSYLGYGTATLEKNLSPAVHQRKKDIFRNYTPHEEGCRAVNCPPDTGDLNDDYDYWTERLYRRRDPAPARGTVVSWMGSTSPPNTYSDTARCLTREGNGRIRASDCEAKKGTQQWRLVASTLRRELHGRCLLATASPRMGSCARRHARDWKLTTAGQVRSGSRCLSQDDFILPNPRLRMRRCDITKPSQRWFVGKGTRVRSRSRSPRRD